MEWTLIYLAVSICSACIINTSVFLFYPNNPASFLHILPHKWYTIFIMCMFYIYIIPYCYMHLLLLVQTVLPLGLLVIRILVKELRFGRPKYLSIDSLRKPQNLQIVYRMGQILILHTNALFGKILIPIQTFTTLMSVFGAYVAIKHNDKMKTMSLLMVLGWTLIAAVGWGLCLTLGGYLHSNGQKILGSWRKYEWKSKKERNEMKKFVRSCKPIVICYGKIFVVRRVSLMIFVRGLTRGLVRVILMLDK